MVTNNPPFKPAMPSVPKKPSPPKPPKPNAQKPNLQKLNKKPGRPRAPMTKDEAAQTKRDIDMVNKRLKALKNAFGEDGVYDMYHSQLEGIPGISFTKTGNISMSQSKTDFAQFQQWAKRGGLESIPQKQDVIAKEWDKVVADEARRNELYGTDIRDDKEFIIGEINAKYRVKKSLGEKSDFAERYNELKSNLNYILQVTGWLPPPLQPRYQKVKEALQYGVRRKATWSDIERMENAVREFNEAFEFYYMSVDDNGSLNSVTYIDTHTQI